jgi:hypothetical protein
LRRLGGYRDSRENSAAENQKGIFAIAAGTLPYYFYDCIYFLRNRLLNMENFTAGQKVRSTLGKIFTVTGQIGHRVFVKEQVSWLHAENLWFWKGNEQETKAAYRSLGRP